MPLTQSMQKLKSKGHEFIEKLILEKPANMHIQFARATIYYWINWEVLGNKDMLHWYDGWHFSNMSRQQMQQVITALENARFLDILVCVEGLRIQSDLAKSPKRAVSAGAHSSTTQTSGTIHEVSDPSFWHEQLRFILYGDKGNRVILDTASSKQTQDLIQQYLLNLAQEAPSSTVHVNTSTDGWLITFLNNSFLGSQSAQAIKDFIVGYFEYIDQKLKPAEANSSQAMEAEAGTSANPPVATKPKKRAATPPRERDKFKQQRENKAIEEDIRKIILEQCYEGNMLNYERFKAKVLNVYGTDIKLHDTCFDVLINISKEKHEEEQTTSEEAPSAYAAIPAAPSTDQKPEVTHDGETVPELVQSSVYPSYKSKSKARTKKGKEKQRTGLEPKKTKSKPDASLVIANKAIFIALAGDYQAFKTILDTYKLSKSLCNDILFIACIKGYAEIAAMLIHAGADVNSAQNDGFTPLIYAVCHGYTEIAAMLIHAGADVNQARHNGTTPLFDAAYQGRTKIAEMLISAGANVKQARDDGATPILIASQEGHTEIVKMLVCAGADVEQAHQSGAKSLFIAVQRGHKGTVEVLLDAGADPNKTGQDGTTPVLMAVQKGYTEIAKILINKGGADVNKARDDGTTPLFYAVFLGCTEMLGILIRAGADVNQARNDGATSFMVAIQNKHKEIAAILIRAGAYVTSLLFEAVKDGDQERVEFIIRAGANIDLQDEYGNTALMVAITCQNVAMVSLLVTAGADVRVTKPLPKPPGKMNSLELAKYLLKIAEVASKPGPKHDNLRAIIEILEKALKQGEEQTPTSEVTAPSATKKKPSF